MMLDVSVLREGRTVYTGGALNDAVVTKGAMARVVRLQVSTGEDQLGIFSGDGVGVATPADPSWSPRRRILLSAPYAPTRCFPNPLSSPPPGR